MIDEKKLINKLECYRWKMASDTTPMQALEVKFGNEMLDMILCVIDNQPQVQQIARTPEEIDDVTHKDFEMERKAYEIIVDYLESKR